MVGPLWHVQSGDEVCCRTNKIFWNPIRLCQSSLLQFQTLSLKYDYSTKSDHVNWMFEIQVPDTISAILESGNTIDFKLFDLMPFDDYCVGYCIVHSHCQWKLVFSDNITEEHVTLLSVGGSALFFSKQNTIIVGIVLRYDLESCPDEEVLSCLFDQLPLTIHADLQEVI